MTMQIGLGIGTTFRRKWVPPLTEQIRSLLFNAGQQGGVYLFDKAHQASAFQGSAYDTPLSAVEQFIGSFYDLSGNANHYSQTTSTARGKWSARVNLLTKTEDFADAAWQKGSGGLGTNPVVTQNTALSPRGDMTADTVSFALNGGTSYADRSYLTQSFVTSAGSSYKAGISIKASGPADIGKKILFRHAAGSVYRLITLSAEWQTISTQETAVGGSAAYLLELRGASGGASDSCAVDIWGASPCPAINAHLPYQRVNTAADYDTAGFPPYLLPDGADDYYTSASGGGSTTGIFICAAIAPWAAGAKQVIWSDASGNTGYELCINASNQVEFSAGTGSARVSCVSAALSFGAPKVITAQHDGTNLTVRVDGVATTAACGAASAGTAGATLLRTNGASSNYAKLQINGLVQRHGAQPSAQELAFTERHMVNLQGRTL